jgi:hypothetical protein
LTRITVVLLRGVVTLLACGAARPPDSVCVQGPVQLRHEALAIRRVRLGALAGLHGKGSENFSARRKSGSVSVFKNATSASA